MGKAGTKPIIGIIGGIGSGKSTVAAEFAKLGCKVIDADHIAHELLDQKNVQDEIKDVFGDVMTKNVNEILSEYPKGSIFFTYNEISLTEEDFTLIKAKGSNEIKIPIK